LRLLWCWVFIYIINKVQTIFYQDNNLRYDIIYCECLFKDYVLDYLYADLIDYYTYKPRRPIRKQEKEETNTVLDDIIKKDVTNANNKNKLDVEFFMKNQLDLCKALDISNNDFSTTMNSIRQDINNTDNRGGLQIFYIQFLNQVATDGNKINLIKIPSDISLLNKIFEEFFYSLILDYHIKDGNMAVENYVNDYIKKVITNLCNSINNINLNNILNKKIKNISKKIDNKNLVKYFFNDFSIYFKINQIIKDENNAEPEKEEYCDAFYLPDKLLLINSGNVDLDKENIIIGLSNLNKKNSPPIKLQTTILFDTDEVQTYCLKKYTLDDNDIEFEK